ITASGCGVMLRDYGHILADDPLYADKAARVVALARDPVEVVADAWDAITGALRPDSTARTLAFHPPCTLQHGLKIRGVAERLLTDIGYSLVPVPDAHLCCGSAGTYSILQPELAGRLKANKLQALEARRPDVIATANIGCMTHLQSGTDIPLRHWIELLDEALDPQPLAGTAAVPARAATK
ncbi:MAG: heterodisulfide reductase-related iron-sulfur binding cluster, partial [Betaproteobacteria bacterium]